MGGSSSQRRTDPGMYPINAFRSKSCWVAISENSKHGNARKEHGFWCEVLQYKESKTKQYVRQTYDMESGTGDEDCINRAMTHYEIKTGLPFKYHHCWESGDADINLNTNVGNNDEDKVQKIQQPGGRDKARAAGKNKEPKASGSSTMNGDALTRLMVTEMTAAEKEQCEAFIEIKRRKVECHE
ncbi:hypothetical protein Tco_1068368 [Tanacetum coccineum]|uniref:No apical meristem-associated C-terminal domain-containing protein n=1 Tax=Tanacetum coccineum TaxID=301880 RepID=A0ABQ5HGZ6_9ASTR